MARVPYVEADKHPELKELSAQICAQRGGKVSHLYAALLNSPPVCDGWLRFLTAIRQQTVLPGNYRELVILHVAVLNGAQYEYKSHIPHAVHEGVTQQQADDLENWRSSKAYDAKMRAVLEYSETMTRKIEVPDPVYTAVSAIFSAREMVELTALIASYNLVSRFLVALHIGT